MAALGVGAAGGFMNLEVAGISDAAMPMALAIGLLEVAGSEALAGKFQTSVGPGSSLLFLVGVGSGGAFIHCHLFSSQDISYTSAYGMGGWSPAVYGAAVALAVDVVVLLGVGADVVSGLALADAVNVVAVGGGVLLAVAAEVVDAGASGGGIGWGGTGSGCWPQSGSYGWHCLYHTRWAWESH